MARGSDPIRAQLAATHVVRTLQAAGHIAYFAGGCVRDGLLGLHPTDFDVATDAPPQRVRALFPRSAEVGAAFGVILVHVSAAESGGAPADRGPLVNVEVATFRSDGPYTDVRRPDTVHFSDPRSDAERRDFTINALYLDPLAPPDESASPSGAPGLQGRVVDYVGGLRDLKLRVIRAVGDPDKRLAEDHLRALRAVRFAARLGFRIDPAAAAAITRHASELKGVSRERIGQEIRRAVSHPSRGVALGLLEQLTLDAPVLGESALISRAPIASALPASAEAVTCSAAWALDRESTRQGQPAWLSDLAATELVARWRAALMLSNEEFRDLEDQLNGTWAITQRWEAMRVSQRKRLASRIEFAKCLDIVRSWNEQLASTIQLDKRELETDGIGLNPVTFVTGDDLIASGMKPSPRFRGVLDQVRDAQLEGRVRSKQEGMELAHRLSVQP